MSETIVSVVGLGYVGLPVAVEFAKKYPTIGFDVKKPRVQELQKGQDSNLECSEAELANPNLQFSSELSDLRKASFHIVAVPTPIDDARKPDLKPLIAASGSVGKILKKGDTVVFESTVYPGVTEEVCVPVLEKFSGLQGGIDFKVGYSPERINPGDKEHSFTKITKVVSGQDEETLAKVATMYGAVVTAGVHRASSIKVAEAAKVIENTQRDLNIALMNELSIIFDRMNIDTQEVLEAAQTKWNFLKFFPGLVGGHCIGVDPYYLTYQAEKLDYHPQVILAGRRINDQMGKFVAQKCIKEMIHAGHPIKGANVTVLGLTFKENVPDIRNTRAIDIIRELQEYGVTVQVCDPLVPPEAAQKEFGVKLFPLDDLPPAHSVIAVVAHDEFRKLSTDSIKKLSKENPVLIDVKGMFHPGNMEREDIRYWRL